MHVETFYLYITDDMLCILKKLHANEQTYCGPPV